MKPIKDMNGLKELHKLRANCEECLKQRIPPMSIDFLILETVFQTLQRNNWNRTWTGQDLNMNKRTLLNWINRLENLQYPVQDSPYKGGGKYKAKNT